MYQCPELSFAEEILHSLGSFKPGVRQLYNECLQKLHRLPSICDHIFSSFSLPSIFPSIVLYRITFGSTGTEHETIVTLSNPTIHSTGVELFLGCKVLCDLLCNLHSLPFLPSPLQRASFKRKKAQNLGAKDYIHPCADGFQF